MLEIKPIQDKTEQERICKLCGVEFDIDSLAYAAYVDDVLTGVGQFLLKNGNCYLNALANVPGINDTEALFIMGRGLLNYVDLIGIHDAYLSNPGQFDHKLITWVGFLPDEKGNYYMNLRGRFDGKHSHNE